MKPLECTRHTLHEAHEALERAQQSLATAMELKTHSEHIKSRLVESDQRNHYREAVEHQLRGDRDDQS